MCLTIPLKVREINKSKATMDDGRVVDVSLVGKIKVGDYLLVKLNLAVEKLSKKEAVSIRSAIKETYKNNLVP
jgi:hydrogenase assembly chaperone HypC/HupF